MREGGEEGGGKGRGGGVKLKSLVAIKDEVFLPDRLGDIVWSKPMTHRSTKVRTL